MPEYTMHWSTPATPEPPPATEPEPAGWAPRWVQRAWARAWELAAPVRLRAEQERMVLRKLSRKPHVQLTGGVAVHIASTFGYDPIADQQELAKAAFKLTNSALEPELTHDPKTGKVTSFGTHVLSGKLTSFSEEVLDAAQAGMTPEQAYTAQVQGTPLSAVAPGSVVTLNGQPIGIVQSSDVDVAGGITVQTSGSYKVVEQGIPSDGWPVGTIVTSTPASAWHHDGLAANTYSLPIELTKASAPVTAPTPAQIKQHLDAAQTFAEWLKLHAAYGSTPEQVKSAYREELIAQYGGVYEPHTMRYTFPGGVQVTAEALHYHGSSAQALSQFLAHLPKGLDYEGTE